MIGSDDPFQAIQKALGLEAKDYEHLIIYFLRVLLMYSNA